MRLPRLSVLFSLSLLLMASFALPASAEDRSFYSPVIFIDKAKNQILISTIGKCHSRLSFGA